MPKFNREDAVLVLFPFADGSNAKKRPAIVVREEYTGEFLVCQITSTNRSDKLKGFWIAKDSEEGESMGVLSDSFVNASNTTILKQFMFDRKIGSFKRIDDLEDLIDGTE